MRTADIRTEVSVNADSVTFQSAPQRRIWTRSVMIAGLLHLSLAGYVMWQFAGAPAYDAMASSNLLSGTIVHPVETPPVSLSQNVEANDDPGSALNDTPSDTTGVAVQPDDSYLRRAAQSILSAADRVAASDAFDELEHKARIIEQISSPEAVARIATGVREALGVRPIAQPAAAEPAGPFDYDRCVLVTSERHVSDACVEIRETLRDRAGRSNVLSYFRCVDPASGLTTYHQTETTARGMQEFGISEEEFADAQSRQRPYEIINRFSLVKQIHDQAVLPILDKLANEGDDAPDQSPDR